MQVSVSVKGRFHAFYLANQLQKQKYLNQLITSYPKFEAKKYGVQTNVIDSIVVHELLFRGWNKLPYQIKRITDPVYRFSEIYDYHASMFIKEDSDIFVGWSSNALHSMRKAKNYGAVTILERGSGHILYQRDILKSEAERLGVNASLPHPQIVEKELKEYQEADFISIPSLYVKRTFLEHGIPEEKLIHVPYGVNLDNFSRVKKEDNVFRIIFCGAASVRKGIPYLLKAFTELNLPNSELWLIGSITDDVKSFLTNLPSNIIHKGPFPENELYKYYSQGSVFCLPSIEEGFGMVLVQAMACGLPVICTKNTGGEDIIREGIDGYIVPIREVESLKEKILYLYEHKELCRIMGDSARSRVDSGYTWDDYGRKMIKEYSKALSNLKK